jgi:hypothetical protein
VDIDRHDFKITKGIIMTFVPRLHAPKMAEEFQSPYPPPPVFYKLYTSENLRRHQEQRKDETQVGAHFGIEGLVLPSLGPPEPISGEYECFGVKTSVSHLGSPMISTGILTECGIINEEP